MTQDALRSSLVKLQPACLAHLWMLQMYRSHDQSQSLVGSEQGKRCATERSSVPSLEIS